MTPKKKLIEVALPLEAINLASVREGYIYRGRALKVAPCEGYEPCIPEVFDVPAVG